MLKKKYLVRKQKEFDQVFAEGRYVRDKELVLKVRENRLDFSRIGVVVSSKVSKKAVFRNKLRRQLKGIFLKDQKKIKTGYDLVVISLNKNKHYSYQELEKSFLGLLIKLKLYVN